jgi:hypothetical protein
MNPLARNPYRVAPQWNVVRDRKFVKEEVRPSNGRPLNKRRWSMGGKNLAQQTQPACEKAAKKEGEKEAEE